MEISCIYTEIDTNIGREQGWVDVRPGSVSYGLGADISLPPCLIGGPAQGRGADWQLKLSSQYKRSAGRNAGDTRHGTPLKRHV